MAITRRLASGLWLILTIAADHASAQVLLRDMGGSTGGQFTDTCPTDQNLAGVELRGGEWVDAIRAVCVKAFGPDDVAAPILTTGSGLVSRQMAVLGTVIDVPEVAPGWNGGPGGRIVQLLCPDATPVVFGASVTSEGDSVSSQRVKYLNLFCGVAAASQPAAVTEDWTNERPSAVFKGLLRYTDRGAPEHDKERCPEGRIAVGVHGRAGKWLDAVGLVCDTPRISAYPSAGRPIVRAGGRVKLEGPETSEMSACEAARAARARNSPAAAGLEARCRAEAPVVRAGGRVKLESSSGPPPPICDTAAAARDRNSPAAPGLEAQCRAAGGVLPDRASDLPPTSRDLAMRGNTLALADPLAAALRTQQSRETQHGFDIGMGAAEGQTLWGPGKQKLLDSLAPAEQEGFKVAVSFSLDRNKNLELAAVGAAIAEADPDVAKARSREPDARYWLGFDIASGIFGDPARGARGNTQTGPGSLAIRDALSAPAQRGFNASVRLHLSRRYQ
jgi:hypothetical protein